MLPQAFGNRANDNVLSNTANPFPAPLLPWGEGEPDSEPPLLQGEGRAEGGRVTANGLVIFHGVLYGA